jgi:vacuolar protein sorting-associated protein 13A/C
MNFFKIFLGEIIESCEISMSQDVCASQDTLTARVGEIRSVDIINILLNFEIKEVCNFNLFL